MINLEMTQGWTDLHVEFRSLWFKQTRYDTPCKSKINVNSILKRKKLS